MGVNVQQRAATVCIVAYLGCASPSWPGGIHAHLARSAAGTRVVEVEPGSGAERAGLLPDDRVLAVDGQPLTGLTHQQVHELLQGEVGSKATLLIQRGEQQLTIAVERTPYRRRSTK